MSRKPETQASEVLAAARSKADTREANRQPIDYPAMNKMFKRQRAALTRAVNSKSADLVVLACREAVREWNAAGAAWPDEWSRWQRALDDVLPFGTWVTLEDLAGELPVEPEPKKTKKTPAWVPKERNPLEMSPVVEKFLSWRFQPTVRPKAGSLTGRQKDRLLRLALVQKRTNWHSGWRAWWAKLRADGATDAELMLVCHREFGASKHINHQDKRRALVTYYRKGKKAVFVIGEDDDPDRYVLEGLDLLCAVRRTMNVKRNY